MDFENDSTPISERTPLGWTICGGLTPRESIFNVREVLKRECSCDTVTTEDNVTLEKLHERVRQVNRLELSRYQALSMASLPSYRLDIKTRPFELCGVDCCGPLPHYSKKSRHKRDVCDIAYTWMKTRELCTCEFDCLSAEETFLAVRDLSFGCRPMSHIYIGNTHNLIRIHGIIQDDNHEQLVKKNKFVISTDSTVKPAKWLRQFDIIVHIGRDRISRIAEIKLTSIKYLDWRSAQRLVELKTYYDYFGTVVLKSKQKIKNSQKENSEKSMEMELNQASNQRLIQALGGTKFIGKADFVNGSSDPYSQDIQDMVKLEHFIDRNNERTVKINRLPSSYSFFELIIDFTKLNSWVTRIVADSVSQERGYFAHVTFDRQSDAGRILSTESMEFADRSCKITVPYALGNLSKRGDFQYERITWDKGSNLSQQILIVRRKDTSGRKIAVSLLTDSLWHVFDRLKVDASKSTNKSFDSSVSVPSGSAVKDTCVAGSTASKTCQEFSSNDNSDSNWDNNWKSNFLN